MEDKLGEENISEDPKKIISLIHKPSCFFLNYKLSSLPQIWRHIGSISSIFAKRGPSGHFFE